MDWKSLKTKPKIALVVSIPLIALIAIGLVSINNLGKMLETSGWVNHTYNVLGKGKDVVASAVDMETGMRGYLLSGKENFLEPYESGEAAAYRQIKKLQETVSDNPGQVARLGEVEQVLREWQANVTEPMIALRREIGDAKTMDDVSDLVGEARGKTYFDKFRSQVATFIERERTLLVKREAEFAGLLKNSTMESAKAKATIDWVTHTYKVIDRANAIIAAAVDMETGMRGYLLAGREEFLEPYNSGSALFHDLTASLAKTVSDNPPQVQLLGEIDKTISDWVVDVVEPMIALRREIGDAKTMNDMAALVGEARGKTYFDKFRGLMADFSAEETALMEIRKAANVETESLTRTFIIGGTLLALVICGGLGWMIGNGIASPIARMTDAMKRLADRDMTTAIPGRQRRDEIGDMAAAVQVFKDNMIKADQLAQRDAEETRLRTERAQRIETVTQAFDAQVSEALNSVASASTVMERTASSMSAIASDTNERAATVANAADQASSNVQTVAAATDELTTSIDEIFRQVEQSSRIASNAVDQAQSTDKQVQGLASAAQRIGDVVGLISEIAEQTNLLALNATIEAARAGDMGKGFAVVAAEVKDLASQTGKATEEIGQQIAAIQQETNQAVNAIQAIGQTIGEMSEIATGVASAVEQQKAATGEIARSVDNAASGTGEVSANISKVTQTAGETQTVASQVTETAGTLSEKAELLKSQVEQFLKEVKAA